MSEPAPSSDRELALVVATGLLCAVASSRGAGLVPVLPIGSVGRIALTDVVPLLVLPALVARLALRRPLADFGLRWPGARDALLGSLAGALAMAPFLVLLSRRPEFQAIYPSPAFPPAREHAIGLAFLWTLHHAPQMFALEFCLRGFLLQPLARRFGLPLALLLTGAPYVLLHAHKPAPEWLQSAWAAVVFGVLAWRTRSVVPAFGAHWLVAVAMDALCLYRAGGFSTR